MYFQSVVAEVGFIFGQPWSAYHRYNTLDAADELRRQQTLEQLIELQGEFQRLNNRY
ncbi:hypothetical protein PMG71_05660 [Roseofilum sp. BLCC_M154]|uniref:Uncharacterized protein n=1 Tax=Roseofilum acuticapitatum BLCC-M154 TaxID=3022444 RepID=A0ABT7ARJ2_9CYAN|nr:hypothetical protein [Roseofilum acuticapitatum]MDJ1168906.1 hypothetical protein [Roseofilum acuticapitatum BLCC-M154]